MQVQRFLLVELRALALAVLAVQSVLPGVRLQVVQMSRFELFVAELAVAQR